MEDIIIILAAWFILGAVSALWIYYDMKKRSNVVALWVLAGFLLSLVGLVAYLVTGREEKRFVYPPAPDYGKPEYQFDEKKEAPAPPPAPKVEVKHKIVEEKKIEQIEGAPRCIKCGAAISVHDPRCPGCGRVLH